MVLLALLIGISFSACNGIDVPIACVFNDDMVCEYLGEVCNMEYTLTEACEELLLNLPPRIDLPEVCIETSFDIGTCQPLGVVGDQCAEDADCEADLTCVDSACAA